MSGPSPEAVRRLRSHLDDIFDVIWTARGWNEEAWESFITLIDMTGRVVFGWPTAYDAATAVRVLLEDAENEMEEARIAISAASDGFRASIKEWETTRIIEPSPPVAMPTPGIAAPRDPIVVLTCPDCGRGFKNASGLESHRGSAHPAPGSAPAPSLSLVAAWQPACMEGDELVGWMNAEAKARRRGNRASYPCTDCTASFAVEMRAVGRCNGTPGTEPVMQTAGRPGAVG